MTSHIITEITPLGDNDMFYLADRKKSCFNYPIHRHQEYELNFVSGCHGGVRTVGDSTEELMDYDLVLVGPELEHVWDNGRRTTEGNMREITIQFLPNVLPPEVLQKNIFSSIRKMLERAGRGIAFNLPAIMDVYAALNELTQETDGFYRLQRLLDILYRLSKTDDYHILSSPSFASNEESSDSRRIRRVKDFIAKNYKKEIRLQQLADCAGMAPTAFSRFFRKHTSCSVSDYIIFIRLGYAARMLVDSTMSISEICYTCGFNNVSNFNRIFKKRKGCSPKTFREEYMKKRMLV